MSDPPIEAPENVSVVDAAGVRYAVQTVWVGYGPAPTFVAVWLVVDCPLDLDDVVEVRAHKIPGRSTIVLARNGTA